MKSVRVILTSEASDSYHNLISKASDSKQEETILNTFLQKVELLKEDVHYGQPIAKKLILQSTRPDMELQTYLE